MKTKRYECSKHGKIGDPDCRECWNNLSELAKENNALLINEEGEIIN